MIVVAITDVHGNAGALGRFADAFAAADVVLVTGDVTNFGRRREAADVIEAVRRHNPNVLAVHGNCDYPEVGAYLDEEGVGLHAASRILDGIAFLGMGGSLPCPGRTPGEMEEAEFAALLEAAADGLDPALPWVLVCHQPPRGTALDAVRSGAHVGSRSVREFIFSREPLVCFTGHIHEAAGRDALGRTQLVNPGPARGGRYARAEIDGGLIALDVLQA
jgi:Icc-related predicted phosphoesterase